MGRPSRSLERLRLFPDRRFGGISIILKPRFALPGGDQCQVGGNARTITLPKQNGGGRVKRCREAAEAAENIAINKSKPGMLECRVRSGQPVLIGDIRT